jgi:hypothetical protein
MRSDAGTTLIDVLLVLALVGGTTTVSTPVTNGLSESARARSASGFLSGRFRHARQQAVVHGANAAVVFDRSPDGRWTIRVCEDGNGDGLRRADIREAIDPCPDGPFSIGQLFPGLEIAVDPALRGPGGEPPSADPVRFGVSDLVSFSPVGTCNSGSLYLRSRSGAQYAIRVLGGTGRLRVLRHERTGWREL